jgi:mannose-6-phosphate isomerase
MRYEIESRPWGMYEVLLDSPECKVKRISVAPESRLSYQYHHKRQEQWILVKGILTVIRDGEEYTLDNVGESFTIPKGSKHRAWNQTDELVQFIEVQTGEYFGEDDIIRLEDDYMRSDDVQEFLEEMDKPGSWSEEDDKIYTIGGLSNDKEGSFMKFQNK